MVAESKPFLEEESHFADAKFYMEDEECNFAGLTMFGFKIKEDAKDHDTSSAAQSYQLIKGKSKFTFEGFSKGKKPQIESTDVEVLRKELTLPISSIPKLLLPINSWRFQKNISLHQRLRHPFQTYQSFVFPARLNKRELLNQNRLSKYVKSSSQKVI